MTTYFYRADFPDEAIADCTRPGMDATEQVEYWVRKLNFECPPDDARTYLEELGAYTAEDLADDAENLQRLFWCIMGDFNDGQDVVSSDNV